MIFPDDMQANISNAHLNWYNAILWQHILRLSSQQLHIKRKSIIKQDLGPIFLFLLIDMTLRETPTLCLRFLYL